MLSSLQFVLLNDAATTEIYTYSHTLSLHDALPIFRLAKWAQVTPTACGPGPKTAAASSHPARVPPPALPMGRPHRRTDMGGTGVVDRFLDVFTRYIDSGFGLLGGEVAFIATTLIDRKSGVSGTSGSVRVDFGGGRII